MHIKALTAVLAIAAITAVSSAGQASALSPATANSNNTVTVVAGDSLSSIAGQNGTTYIRLFDANSQIQDPNLIYAGQTIRVPAADEQLPDRFAQVPAPPVTDSDAAPAQPAVATAPTPTPAPSPVAAVAPVVAVSTSGIWNELAQCESGGNWSINTGNGFYGGLQFTLSSWQAVGGSGYPNQASPSEQIARAQILEARQGWGAWPACSAKLGL